MSTPQGHNTDGCTRSWQSLWTQVMSHMYPQEQAKHGDLVFVRRGSGLGYRSIVYKVMCAKSFKCWHHSAGHHRVATAETPALFGPMQQ